MPDRREELESRRPLATVIQNPSSSKDVSRAATGMEDHKSLQSQDIKVKQLAFLKAKRLFLRKRIGTNKRDAARSGPSVDSSEQRRKRETEQKEATADHDKVRATNTCDLLDSSSQEDHDRHRRPFEIFQVSQFAASNTLSSDSHEPADQTGACACASDVDAFVEGAGDFTVSLEHRREDLKKKIASALRKKRRLEEAKGKRVSDENSEAKMTGKQTLRSCVVESGTGKVQRQALSKVALSNNLTTAVDELDRRDLLQRKEAAEQNARLLHFQRLVSKQETMLEHQDYEIDTTSDKISKLEDQITDLEYQLSAAPMKVDELKSRQEIIEGMLERNHSEMIALRDKYSML